MYHVDAITMEENSLKRARLDPDGIQTTTLSSQLRSDDKLVTQNLEESIVTGQSVSQHGHYLPQGEIEPNEPSDSDKFTRFDELIVDFMKEHGMPGLSLVISRYGQVLYAQCYGYATHNRHLRCHHMFRIASVTKILTAVAVLTLYEQGKLKLNQKVFGPKGLLPQYSPSVHGDRRVLRITVRHLLAHSAGWDREIVGDAVFWKHVGKEMGEPEPVSNDVLILYIMTQKLQFTPGSKYAYSNLGYVILGRILEACTGVSYEHYIQTVLAEIGITGMKLGKTFKHQAHPAEVEYFACDEYRCVDSIYPGMGKVCAPYGSYAMETGEADGGWIASPTELLHVMHSLEGAGGCKRILKPETFKLMLEKPSYAKGSCWYGLGLDVSWYRKAWEHGGHIDGATSSVTRNKDGLTWTVLCNYWPTDTDYTSLISYGLTIISGLTNIKTLQVQYSDIATQDRKYLLNIKLVEEDFINVYNIHSESGYRVHWFDGYQVKGRTFINVIWVKDNKNGLCFHNLKYDEIQNVVEETFAKGYVPCHVDSYFLNNSADIKDNVRLCVVFIEGKYPYKLCHNVQYRDLDSETTKLKEDGFIIQCQSPYMIDKLYVAVLYTKSISTGCWPKSNISIEKYQTEFDRQSRYGHLPSYLKVYNVDETNMISAIWSHPGSYLYTAEHDMSKYRVLTDLQIVNQNGFYPLCICGYEDERGHKFAVVCVKEVKTRTK